MGFNLFATRGTAKVLQSEGGIQNITVLNKPSESVSKSSSSSSSSSKVVEDAVAFIQEGNIDLVINITDAFGRIFLCPSLYGVCSDEEFIESVHARQVIKYVELQLILVFH